MIDKQNFVSGFDVWLTNISLFETYKFLTFFETPSIVHFCIVYCVNFWIIGLQNGEP